MIKLNDLQQPPEVLTAIAKIIEDKRFVKGPLATEFEKQWAARCNMRYAIAIGSGAQALEIAIQSTVANIKPQQISTQAHVYKAVQNAITRMGHQFFIDNETPTIYTHHLHDSLPNIEPLIEDCSHCHGYQPIADTAIFSLFPAKILGAIGEAGIIVTNLKEVYEKAMDLRNHGIPNGTNGRMDEIQAATLLAKLPLLDFYIEQRQRIVDMYDKGLGRKTEGTYHYAYCIPGSKEKAQKLLDNGIETAFYYDENYMALPLHPFLSDLEVEKIINVSKTL